MQLRPPAAPATRDPSYLRTGLLIATIGALLLGPSLSYAQPQVSTGQVLDRRTDKHVGLFNPYLIPKYQIPLVIPGVMDHNRKGPNHYDIAVREFKQQILPGGKWCSSDDGDSDKVGADCGDMSWIEGDKGYPATTVWSYGPQQDPIPPGAAPDLRQARRGRGERAVSQFNYPAFTMETIASEKVHVKWVNELVAINKDTGKPYRHNDRRRTFLKHLLPLDQTLHWANPSKECFFYTDHKGPGPPRRVYRTDCAGRSADPYDGPVPLVTHVHGSHVDPSSDGYPEAWWLPAYSNTQFNEKNEPYATKGKFFDDATGENPGNLGYARFEYRNDQAATTLWFHDHSLGITRLNVYAGPAAFWMIRGGRYDHARDGGPGRRGRDQLAVLPGPPAKRGQSAAELNLPGPEHKAIREIPILIQDRTFLDNGNLFYPGNRAFFETLNDFDNPAQFNRDLFDEINADAVDACEDDCVTIPGNPELPIGRLKGRMGNADGAFPFAPPEAPMPPRDSNDLTGGSMMPPIWNTEAFFNTIVVNGAVWPKLEVARALYRFRFLNGANARTFNMSLVYGLDAVGGKSKSCEQLATDLANLKCDGGANLHNSCNTNDECPGGSCSMPDHVHTLPFLQIGSDGGFLPNVVEIKPGYATKLRGDGSRPSTKRPTNFPAEPVRYSAQGLLMAPAERADTIVDFSDLPSGTEVCLVNTAPDSPFGGFHKGDAAADANTTGQVMKFVVDHKLRVPRDKKTTDPYSLNLASKPIHDGAGSPKTVKISLNERDTNFPIAWLNVCQGGRNHKKACGEDKFCNPMGHKVCKGTGHGSGTSCDGDNPCGANQYCDYPFHCGRDLPLLEAVSNRKTTGNFAVCALVECTDESQNLRRFSVPPSGFEDNNPCANPPSTDAVGTIDIVGLSVEKIPVEGDRCSIHNMCSNDHTQHCNEDQDCNPNGVCSMTNKSCLNNKDDQGGCPDGGCCKGGDMDTCVFPNPCLLGKAYGPMVDLLGTVSKDPAAPQGIPLRWTDDTGISRQVPISMQDGSVRYVGVSEYPAIGDTQDWEIYNFTPDAHPIHVHLVQFNVKHRRVIEPLSKHQCDKPGVDQDKCGDSKALEIFPQEKGWKDTVIAHPGQVTKVRAKFDIAGLYVWHCHILEHEDNEMMRPFAVKGADDDEDSDTDSDSRRDDDSDDSDSDSDSDSRKKRRRN